MRRHIRQSGKKCASDAGLLQKVLVSVVGGKRNSAGLQLVQYVGCRHSGDLPCHQSGCGEWRLRRVGGVLVRLRRTPGMEGAGRIADRFRFLGTDWTNGRDGKSQKKTCDKPPAPLRPRNFKRRTGIKAQRPTAGLPARVLHHERPLDESGICRGTAEESTTELRSTLPRPGCA